MINIKVDNVIIEHCQKQVEQHNFGQRREANGDKEKQLTGIIGQCVVMQLFNHGLIDGSTGFDGGVDIEFAGLKIDVKTMGRTTDAKKSYTNNFLKLQDHFETDAYIFCSLNKTSNELSICGWIDKQSFVNKRRYYPANTIRTRSNGTSFNTFADLYEIDNYQLNDIKDIVDLKNQLTQFSNSNGKT